MSWSWLQRFPRWLRGLLGGAVVFVLFIPVFDSWSWIGPAILGILAGLDQGYDLSDRLDAHIRRFEWDKARVALRTLYFSLMIGGMLFLFGFNQEPDSDGFSWGLLLALAVGGGFVSGFMATVTETPEECSPSAGS